MNETTARALPAGACDCHVHFYGDPREYVPRADAGLAAQRGSAAEYRELMQRLGHTRVVAVQSILYGFDNRCMLEGMAQIGTGARGVAVVAPRTPIAELRMLDRSGVCGARAFMLPGGVLAWDELEPLARRIAGLGWHMQVQLDGGELAQRARLLESLPCPVVIDHVGKFLEPVDTGHPSFQALLRLLDSGRVWVKLSAPYETSRTGPPEYADVAALACALLRHSPERMVWATNWPHPGRAEKPSEAQLLDLLHSWTGKQSWERVLAGNPAALYGFPCSSADRRTALTQ
ncbi:MAG: amidohydrolase family protein [Burkholderiaceae bacterium]|nr:amidohydrolase family protein [Burkholderiaceae bacterium]